MSIIPYNASFNNDDVIFRNVIIGCLASLNRFVFWKNKREDGTEDLIEVPFYFSTTGDERFLKDMFMNDIDYNPSDGCAAETFYNVIPRAIVTTEGFSILSDANTNRWVRGQHLVSTDDGEMKTYSSEINMVPIEMTFNITGYCDSYTDMMKMSSALISLFHKNLLYHIEFENIRVPCTLELADEHTHERTTEWGFTDKKEWKVSLSITCRFRYPVIRKETSIFVGKSIKEFPCSIFVGSNGQVSAVTTNGITVPLVYGPDGRLQPLDPNLLPD